MIRAQGKLESEASSWGQDTRVPLSWRTTSSWTAGVQILTEGHTPTLYQAAALMNTARASVNTSLKAEGLLCDHGSVC